MSDSDRAELVRSLVRRWRTSALIVVVAALGGLAYGELAPRTYTAEAFLVAVPQVPGDTTSAQAFATAYSRLATQPAVLAAAATASGIPQDTLRAAVSAAISPDAPVISISGSSHDASAASADANAVASALSNLSDAHLTDTSVRLTILASAQPPSQPSSPSATLDVGLGAAAGVLLASLAALAGSGAAGRRREPDAEAEAAAAPTAPSPPNTSRTPVASPPAPAPLPDPEGAAPVPSGTPSAEGQTETNHIAPVNEHTVS